MVLIGARDEYVEGMIETVFRSKILSFCFLVF